MQFVIWPLRLLRIERWPIRVDEAALVMGVVMISVPGKPRWDFIGHEYCINILELFAGPETHLCEYPGCITRVPDTECL
jgi:hypothetical protein